MREWISKLNAKEDNKGLNIKQNEEYIEFQEQYQGLEQARDQTTERNERKTGRGYQQAQKNKTMVYRKQVGSTSNRYYYCISYNNYNGNPKGYH